MSAPAATDGPTKRQGVGHPIRRKPFLKRSAFAT